jgi:glycosyltransferase involved in cell wall biosynthesis
VTSHGLTKGYASLPTAIASETLSHFSKTFVLKRASLITTVSLSEYNCFKGEFLDKLHYIPNGVDTKTFKQETKKRQDFRKALSLEDSDIVVLYFAQLRASKGILTLLKAIDIVLKRNQDVKFIIAGTGPLARQTTKELRFYKDQVRSLLHYIPDSTLPYLYNACDMYILPSFVEGMPLSLMEAMASGKPVIVTNVGNVPAFVKQGINGVIVPPGNANALAEGIISLARNPALRKRMGETNALEMAECDWERIASQYHSLYLKVFS